jgi:hypothetical protein
MKPISLGTAASATSGLAQSVGQTALAATRPFAEVLQMIAQTLQPESDDTEATTAAESDQLSLSSLAQRIQQVLANAGITLDGPLSLQLSSGGNYLQVAGDTPQRVQIEAALGHDPTLADDLRTLLEAQEPVVPHIGPQAMGLGLPQSFGLGTQADAVFSVADGQPLLELA